MSLVIPLHHVGKATRHLVGGKAFALAMMRERGFRVPEALCITTTAYRQFVEITGILERIWMELSRKNLDQMRWEELWDASLRIRNLFLNTPLPLALSAPLQESIGNQFLDKAVVVRSSAPGEDSVKASFAGLHESFVNIRGTEAVLEHVKKVWASLWSDAALLYRREMSLDVGNSTMAVLVQEIVTGDRSGVVFGRNPNDASQAVLESVYGLNQGLVDGAIEPDSWIIDRSTGKIVHHKAPKRDKQVIPSGEGVTTVPLSEAQSQNPPLSPSEVGRVFDLALLAENLFGSAQDVEWTFRADALYALQSRPITTGYPSESDDKRPWYLSLRKSYESLKSLRKRIERELIPAMADETLRLATRDLKSLSDKDLADEIEFRADTHEKWVKVYFSEFVPFAHGARLFGQVYNDALHPSDPYEFMELLGATEMVSLERNRRLEEMAEIIREDAELREALTHGDDVTESHPFDHKLQVFMERFGDLSCGTTLCLQGPGPVVRILLEMSSRPAGRVKPKMRDLDALQERFLSHFEGEKRQQAVELLDLARASYRLRDDDNIHLGMVEAQMLSAADQGRKRLAARGRMDADRLSLTELIALLRDPTYTPKTGVPQEAQQKGDLMVKPRQLIGQPAGPGLSKGLARVIRKPSDLSDFKAEEILVCDAIDPNMTFVVPLSAGIVERRGGMLIHGAIIAREYGLPCVTGVPDATLLIRTGDSLTVDGYLGIVIIG
jgi:phosphoenolpyruvate synthase/pyruvate phosphate dikinase